VELEVLVAGIGALLAHVPAEAGGTKPGAGDSPLHCFGGAVRTDPLGPRLEDAVAERHAVVLAKPRRHPPEERPHFLLPPAREILRDPANTKPARMHASAADGLDDLEHALAIREHVEHRREAAHVL